LPTTAIRFNRDPQAGGFLIVTANGPPDASGYAVDVTVDNSESMRVNVVGPGGSFEVTAPFFQLDANGGIMRFKDTSLFDVQATAFQHTGTDFAVFVANDVSVTAGNDVSVTAGNDVSVTLGTAGTSVTVLDSGGNPLFRVNENGDLQGKTGKALVFNL
jgi:hypothetical protein